MKNSGAHHSSRTMCASGWPKTTPQGGVTTASDRPLAAVPDDTGNTNASCSKMAETSGLRRAVTGSSPYGWVGVSLTRAMASRMAGGQPRMLSERKFMPCTG